jgi:hypothetical protein
MTVQTQVQDVILNDLASRIYSQYQYLQVDTGTVLPSVTGVELTNGGTQVGGSAALFNKLHDTGTNGSRLSGNIVLQKWVLESGEPYTQPINIGSFGAMIQATEGAGLGVPALLPAVFTKDTNLRAIVRGEFKIIRTSEVVQ